MTTHTINSVLRLSTAKVQPRYRGKYPSRVRSVGYSREKGWHVTSNDHRVLVIPPCDIRALPLDIRTRGINLEDKHNIETLAAYVADYRNGLLVGRSTGRVAARVKATIDRYCVGFTWRDDMSLREAEENFSSVVVTALTPIETRNRGMNAPYSADAERFNRARAAAREAAKADYRVTACNWFAAARRAQLDHESRHTAAGPIARLVMAAIGYAESENRLYGPDVGEAYLSNTESRYSAAIACELGASEHHSIAAREADERVPLPDRPRGLFSVAVYMIDRAYGGPEEGGWYYTAGDIVAEPDMAILLRMFEREGAAYAYARKLDSTVIAEANRGRPSIGSVLSRGVYAARVQDGFPPEHFPATRPYYE